MTQTLRKRSYISRRDFIKISAWAVAGAGVAAACQPNLTETEGVVTTPIPIESQYPEVPFAPAAPPPFILVSLTSEEAKAVEALTARIYPGDESDRGRVRRASPTSLIRSWLFTTGTSRQPILLRPMQRRMRATSRLNRVRMIKWSGLKNRRLTAMVFSLRFHRLNFIKMGWLQ